ncbi:MAG: hypothetical protein SFW62_06880 [Alphaproteobacteria bacterium]|nr:hypothetical protein [Alphaproteobacteria bacterium]
MPEILKPPFTGLEVVSLPHFGLDESHRQGLEDAGKNFFIATSVSDFHQYAADFRNNFPELLIVDFGALGHIARFATEGQFYHYMQPIPMITIYEDILYPSRLEIPYEMYGGQLNIIGAISTREALEPANFPRLTGAFDEAKEMGPVTWKAFEESLAKQELLESPGIDGIPWFAHRTATELANLYNLPAPTRAELRYRATGNRPRW